MPKQQAGFTLIELMIVVAIIGILSAIAVPILRDYIVRSQAIEGANLATVMKSPIMEVYTLDGDFAKADSGYYVIPASQSGEYVDSITVLDGVVTVMYKTADIATELQGRTLILEPITVPSFAGEWNCYSPDIDPKYLPPACR